MRLAVQLIEELEVKARLVGEAVGAVQHKIPSESGVDRVFGDADAERKEVREGADEELVAVGNVIDGVLRATAKEALLLCLGRIVGVVRGRLPHGSIECVEEELVGVLLGAGGVNDDDVVHDEGQVVGDATRVEVRIRSRVGLLCGLGGRSTAVLVEITSRLLQRRRTVVGVAANKDVSDPRDVLPDLGVLHEARRVIVHNLRLTLDEILQRSEGRAKVFLARDDRCWHSRGASDGGHGAR